MAKIIHKLTDRFVREVSQPGYFADGDNLYLQVRRDGAKSWIHRFTNHEGVRRDFGLGSLRDYTLIAARKRNRAARQLVHDGIDPIEHKKAAKIQARAEAAASTTVREECEEFFTVFGPTWKHAGTADQHRRQFGRYVYPVIGDLPVRKVDVDAVARVFSPIWTSRTETAHRMRQLFDRILSRCISLSRHPGPNPARWEDNLENILPARRKVAAIKHHAAMAYQDLPSFVTELRARSDLSARALELLILCASRTTEVRAAEWAEFDLDAGVWTIPGQRMKGKIEHRVPLSGPALAILRGLDREPGQRFLFQSRGADRPISNAAMSALLSRLGHGDFTVHGMRSAFRTWAGEMTRFPHEVCEASLAHKISDGVVAAYLRTDFFEKRRQLMQSWASYLGKPVAKAKGDVLVAIKKAAQ